MHTLAVQIAPVLAAEKSKVPFFIAGGLLVVWALTVSLGLGLRKPDFPNSLGQQRAVIATTAVLVLAAVSTAVITAGPPSKSATATEAAQTNSVFVFPPNPAPPSSTSASSAAAAAAPASTTPVHTQALASGGAANLLTLEANRTGLLEYNTKQLTAKAGTVTITMANMSPVEHNVTIAQGTTVLGATPTFTGGTRSVTLKLKPGTYTFYCSVPGHRQAGMEGTLKVS